MPSNTAPGKFKGALAIFPLSSLLTRASLGSLCLSFSPLVFRRFKKIDPLFQSSWNSWFYQSGLASCRFTTCLHPVLSQGRKIESFTLVEILTLLETCTKRGPLLGLNLFISHDRPVRITYWGLFCNTFEFLYKLNCLKGSRRYFLLFISGRLHVSNRENDSKPNLRQRLGLTRRST